MSHDVFISYSSKDKITADMVCAMLERHKIRCWIAPRDVLPGSAWGAAIVNAINETRLMVLVFSKAANTSPQIEREVERVISKGRPVIPFRIDDVQPSESLEYFISASHWLDAVSGPIETHIETLATVIRHILAADLGPTKAAAADPQATVAVAIASSAPAQERRPESAASDAPGTTIRPSAPASRRTLPIVGLAFLIVVIAASVVAFIVLPRLFSRGPPLVVGSSFSDCATCPEMVVVPAGRFSMGANAEEQSAYDWQARLERPPHEVHIDAPFAVGRYMVTRDQFEAFVADTLTAGWDGCNYWDGKETYDATRSFRDPKLPGGPQAGDHPVLCVSWRDAEKYVQWLAAKTGKPYRLLSEAELEYATRAGSTTAFWWGATIAPGDANYWSDVSYRGSQTAPMRSTTVPVQSFKPNPWGLYQVHGNAAEWVEDCFHDTYFGAPSDGSVWMPPKDAGVCEMRTCRNGAWGNAADLIRSARRCNYGYDQRSIFIGFRVARS